ncbi:hypothetical protein Acj9p084 [Acinetobacter phage Acj9]|uniref:Conserved hypothetical phage protein n=1 Tax=Acinetobacter phage Acj9 TaxID=760939 RepID=E5EPL8_9CAUD|nr:hypothetical protein Acj9p084 [Acinetobacter phage Acj9]ADG59984.1 conserved hypothetical phage protein [Acinetobacter phage Acj9]
MTMNKVVILGAGLATRLYPITHQIPKVLVNYGQHTILKHLHDLYANEADEIIVVVHSKFKATVQAYCRMNQLLDVRIVTVDEAYGSAYAISQIPDIEGHNVLFNWCDVIPEFDETGFVWGSNQIFTFGDECRYAYDGMELKEVGATGGNVVGVYNVVNFSIDAPPGKEEANEYFSGRDFIEFIEDITMGPIAEGKLKNLVDLGDKPKLDSAHSCMGVIARDFNHVEIRNDVVVKTAIGEKGIELQDLELKWYLNTKSEFVPRLLNSNAMDHRITLERIRGSELSKVFKLRDLDLVLDSLSFSNSTFHPTNTQFEADLKFEVIDKVISRCKSIEHLVKSFGEIYLVNGVKIGRLEPMLRQAYNHLVQVKGLNEYSVIHGDPNFSNTFKAINGDIKFIDPRGYFGHTHLYGPRMYDECKVLYALTGYDKFNSDPLWGGLNISGCNIDIEIEPLVKDAYALPQFNEYHKLWVAVIWIALGGYFKNNPLKSVAAYYHGMYLLTTALNKLGRRLQDGTSVPSLETAISPRLITRTPKKWVLHDLETGEKYHPSSNPASGAAWDKIQ